LYTVKHIKDLKKNLNYIEIKDFQKRSYAKIHLNLGGSLQELVLNNKHIIKDLYPLSYKSTYASSILFPFANRVARGIYVFDGIQSFLNINQLEEDNALHGFVYNKIFELVQQKITSQQADVLLRYEEQNHTIGFPYTYTIDLKYTLTKERLDLSVSVVNTDSKAFPFTIGWHPYFNSSDLFNSAVIFNSSKKTVMDKNNITLGLKDIILDDKFIIEDKSLDDCFVLDSNEVFFETPEYKFVLTSSEKDCFLQLYTPPKPNTIAIEPTTGISDSFNNGIGIKTLQPNEIYNIEWRLKIQNN
jgi:aldose 1-epimerase